MLLKVHGALNLTLHLSGFFAPIRFPMLSAETRNPGANAPAKDARVATSARVGAIQCAAARSVRPESPLRCVARGGHEANRAGPMRIIKTRDVVLRMSAAQQPAVVSLATFHRAMWCSALSLALRAAALRRLCDDQ